MSAHALYLVRMDVAHDHEATFNEVYDREHVPNLRAVAGVRRASRYGQPSPIEPRYLAAYEMDGPGVVESAAWKTAGELGQWPTRVRPNTMNRYRVLYEWVGGNAALTGKTPYVFWVMMDVERHREALFNDLYDNEHLPLLLELPGSVYAVRYRITTSDGVEGVGYVVYPRPDLMTTIGHAARELGEHLIGMSVLEPEAAWDRLARRGDWVGPGGLLHCALAPLDIAVWDAAGKTLGQPLHRLLGGYPDRLPTYASDGLWVSLSPDDLAVAAKRHADDGFPAVKPRLGKEATPEAEARRVPAVREAVGPDDRIMVDPDESWSLTRARRPCRG